jgi:hypothetical protein
MRRQPARRSSSGTTRRACTTNLSEKYAGKSGYGIYADGMMEMDDTVGELLKVLDETGVADNTIVMFSTDNGAAANSWPDRGNTPFHGEKGLAYEGGFRVPMLVKWPGRIPAGSVTGQFMTMEDWLPTLTTAVGQPDIKEKLLQGHRVGDTTYKVHLDGYDQTDLITGEGPSKRQDFYYFTETKAARHPPRRLEGPIRSAQVAQDTSATSPPACERATSFARIGQACFIAYGSASRRRVHGSSHLFAALRLAEMVSVEGHAR